MYSSYNDIKQWVFVNFNWGDSLVELLNYYHIYKKFGVIASVGRHKNNPYNMSESRKIAEWISVQPFVQRVILTHPLELYKTIEDGIADVCNYYGIDPKLVDTSNCIYPNHDGYITYQDSPKLILPHYYTLKNYGIENIGECVLLNPFSVASSNVEGHWKYWNYLITYLFKYTPYKYIIVGVNWHTDYNFDENKNVINLLNNGNGIIESNCDIYNISNKALYTITTFNSLSHWCINQSNPSTIFGISGANMFPWQKTIKFQKENVKFFQHDFGIIPALYHVLRDIGCVYENKHRK